MHRTRLVLVGLAIAGLSAACGSDDGENSSCGLAACGGDVVGTWTYVAQCIEGEVDDQGCGFRVDENNTVTSGTVTLNSDGTYTPNFMTTGTAKISIPADCFQPGAVTDCAMLNDDETTCTGDATAECNCDLTVNSTSTTPGVYTTSGNSVTIDGSTGEYCVNGDTLNLRTGPTATPDSEEIYAR